MTRILNNDQSMPTFGFRLRFLNANARIQWCWYGPTVRVVGGENNNYTSNGAGKAAAAAQKEKQL